jgi:DNA-directed RNA polymerase sigma subunit (sigma70/sigma32)
VDKVNDNDEFVRWILLVMQNTPLLDGDEESRLLDDLRSADPDARALALERLRLSLFRVATSVARKYAGATVHLAEPLRVGIQGIGPAIEALASVEKLDNSPQIKLSTYATRHIRRSIESAGFTKMY